MSVATVVGMVVTITRKGESYGDQNLEKTFLTYPESKDTEGCLQVKMLMLDGSWKEKRLVWTKAIVGFARPDHDTLVDAIPMSEVRGICQMSNERRRPRSKRTFLASKILEARGSIEQLGTSTSGLSPLGDGQGPTPLIKGSSMNQSSSNAGNLSTPSSLATAPVVSVASAGAAGGSGSGAVHKVLSWAGAAEEEDAGQRGHDVSAFLGKGQVGGVKNVLEIFTEKDGYNSGRTYYLQADSEADCKNIVNQITLLAKVERERMEMKSALQRGQDKLRRLTSSQSFQVFFALLIAINFVANAVEMQLNTDLRKNSDGTRSQAGETLQVLDVFFTIIFTFELILVLIANWLTRFLNDGWNIFDCIVVSLSLVALGPLPIPVMVIRSMRAFRVARIFRRIKSLRTIIAALTASIVPTLNSFFVMLIASSIFSIMGVTFFSEMAPDEFGVFFRAWITLFRVTCGDSWVNILPPFDEAGQPNVGVCLFFVVYIVTLTWTLLQVSVAVLIDRFVSSTALMHQEEREQLAADRKFKERVNNPLDPLLDQLTQAYSDDSDLTTRIQNLYRALDTDGLQAMSFAQLCSELKKLNFHPRLHVTEEDLANIVADAGLSPTAAATTTPAAAVAVSAVAAAAGVARTVTSGLRRMLVPPPLGRSSTTRLKRAATARATHRLGPGDFEAAIRRQMAQYIQRRLADVLAAGAGGETENIQMRATKLLLLEQHFQELERRAAAEHRNEVQKMLGDVLQELRRGGGGVASRSSPPLSAVNGLGSLWPPPKVGDVERLATGAGDRGFMSAMAAAAASALSPANPVPTPLHEPLGGVDSDAAGLGGRPRTGLTIKAGSGRRGSVFAAVEGSLPADGSFRSGGGGGGASGPSSSEVAAAGWLAVGGHRACSGPSFRLPRDTGLGSVGGEAARAAGGEPVLTGDGLRKPWRRRSEYAVEMAAGRAAAADDDGETWRLEAGRPELEAGGGDAQVRAAMKAGGSGGHGGGEAIIAGASATQRADHGGGGSRRGSLLAFLAAGSSLLRGGGGGGGGGGGEEDGLAATGSRASTVTNWGFALASAAAARLSELARPPARPLPLPPTRGGGGGELDRCASEGVGAGAVAALSEEAARPLSLDGTAPLAAAGRQPAKAGWSAPAWQPPPSGTRGSPSTTTAADSPRGGTGAVAEGQAASSPWSVPHGPCGGADAADAAATSPADGSHAAPPSPRGGAGPAPAAALPFAGSPRSAQASPLAAVGPPAVSPRRAVPAVAAAAALSSAPQLAMAALGWLGGAGFPAANAGEDLQPSLSSAGLAAGDGGGSRPVGLGGGGSDCMGGPGGGGVRDVVLGGHGGENLGGGGGGGGGGGEGEGSNPSGGSGAFSSVAGSTRSVLRADLCLFISPGSQTPAML